MKTLAFWIAFIYAKTCDLLNSIGGAVRDGVNEGLAKKGE